MVDTPEHLIMNTGQLNIHSPEVFYHNMPIVPPPPPPPPLIRCTSASPDSSPFTLAFIAGNIRVCRGCRQKYSKPALPPLNLCVRHQEWQEFTGPSGDPQTRYGNVYYHCNIPCIWARWPQFTSSMLHIPPTMLMAAASNTHPILISAYARKAVAKLPIATVKLGFAPCSSISSVLMFCFFP